MGEDTRIEVTFNNMSITEAFDIFVIRDMKSIVTRHVENRQCRVI